MITASGILQTGWSDPWINALLDRTEGTNASVGIHFDQNEELFLKLHRPVEVPPFPVHHPVDEREPSPHLRDATRTVIDQISRLLPDALGGFRYAFDPTRAFVPALYRFYDRSGSRYLHLIRVDLSYRPTRSRLIERRSNTWSPHHETQHLFMESDIVPIVGDSASDAAAQPAVVEQSISETWIGETGRGYLRQGVWLDRDLTRFLTKAFVPSDRRLYPYFPFSCKFRAITHATVALTGDERSRSVATIDRARSIVLPRIREIEDSLRRVAHDGFTEQLPTFDSLRIEVDRRWPDRWNGWTMRRYLNKEEQREFELTPGRF
ncbi:MAG: hypothetical protein EA382_04955 [Spirochaetaceae bacterium]|nr:MAG: hypothetical protein EA382_04955 [Spirochaetaceae bacterium]